MTAKSTRKHTKKVAEHTHKNWERTEAALRLSEERFSKAFHASPVAIAITRLRDECFADVNEAMAGLLGFRREELIGHSSVEFGIWANPADRNFVFETLRQGKPLRNKECRFRTRNGRLLTALYAADVIDLGGEPSILCVIVDLTAEKEAAERYAQSVSLLRATLDATADGILVVNRNGQIVDFNEQFVHLWHIPREILDLRDDQQVLTCVMGQLKEPDLFVAKVQELYAKPEADSFDLLEFQDGRVFERHSSPQRINGEPVGRVWSFRDITDRKKSEDLLFRQMAFDAMATKFLARSARCTDSEIDDQIHTSLEELGFFAEVDETYVILYSQNTWSMSHAWHAPNVPGRIQNYREAPLSESQWMKSCLCEGKAVQLHTLDDLPPEAAAERERLSRDGVVSQLLLPLRGRNGVVRGSFGLRSYTRPIQWAPEDIQRMRLLGDAIASALERRRAEIAQRESEARLRTILEAVQTGVFLIDPETHNIVEVNTVAANLVGAPKEKIVGGTCHRYLASAAEGRCPVAEQDTPVNPVEDTLVTANGSRIPVLTTVVPVMLDGRSHILETVVNISVFKQMEERVAQTQKMDAIGQLAGGVAHDFNNIVQVIVGFADIVLANMSPEQPNRQDILEIKEAAMRAGEIASQLLAFSRRQRVSPCVLDLNSVVGNTQKLLQRFLGEDIHLVTQLAPDLKRIYADSGQLSQVIMNLAVNARDAMPHGGRVVIATTNVTISPHDTDALMLPGVQVGDFVCVSVADDGAGMPDHVRSHLFEPFFTTKEAGKGTGLGLSVVYGIVKQCDGWIRVESRLGIGTTFRLYFPVYSGDRITPAAPADAEPAVAPVLRGNGECILLVEDDPVVCNLGTRVLQAANYTVVACSNALDGMALFQNKDHRFDLLFSDVVLPDRNGIALADDLRALNPQLPVLLCSGYTDERSRLTAINEKGYLFLQKPYSSAALLHIIRLLLDARHAQA